MRTAMIWPGSPDGVPCGTFDVNGCKHVVAAMTTDKRNVIVRLMAHCGASTTAPATWTNIATARARGEAICENCVRAAVGEGISQAPATLPDDLVEKLRRQASIESRSLDGLIEEMLAYRRRYLCMQTAASRRGKRRG